MQNHIHPYLNQMFSKYQCGFRKGFNAQHCLMLKTKRLKPTFYPLSRGTINDVKQNTFNEFYFF